MDSLNKFTKLYYFSSVIMTIKVMMQSSSIFQNDLLDEILLGIYLISIVLVMLSLKYSSLQMVMIVVIGMCAVYSSIRTGNFYLVISFLACVAIKGADFDKLINYRMWTKIIIVFIHVLFVVVLFVLGKEIPTITRNGHVRYDFFLGHPNTLQMYVLWSSLEYLYIDFKKLNPLKLSIVFALNLVFYLFTNSNTGILVLVITYCSIFVVKKLHMPGIINLIAQFGFPVVSAITAAMLCLYYGSSGILKKVLSLVDRMTTGRLIMGSYAYNHFGFTMFGQKIYLIKEEFWNGKYFREEYLDSSFMGLLMEYGIIWIILISIGLYLIGKNKNAKNSIFIVSFIAYGIMESYIMNAAIVFPLLLIGCQVFSDKSSSHKSHLHNKLCYTADNSVLLKNNRILRHMSACSYSQDRGGK